jgi:hypothetical protein
VIGMNKTKFFTILFLVLFIGNALAAMPEVSQLNYSPSPAVPGTTITVLVQIENKDSIPQKGVSVKIDNNYPFTVKTENEKNVGNIDKYGKALAEFTIYVDPSAENKTYQIPVTIKTENNSLGVTTTHNIIVSGKEPLIKVIMITAEKVLPGEEKEITFTIQNVGTSPAYDVFVEMQEDRTVVATTGTVVEREITPLGAATTYVGSINPGEMKETKLKVSVSNSATIKNYTLPITISYRNAAGTRTEVISYAGLKVYSSAILDATLKEKTTNGKTEVTIEIFNKGLGKAEFVLVEISATGEVEKPKQFIGSLGASDVDTVKTGIKFDQTGENTLTLTISYMDADAQNKTTNITIPVKQSTTIAEGPNFLLILAILAVLGVIVWKFVLNKKKK